MKKVYENADQMFEIKRYFIVRQIMLLEGLLVLIIKI